MKIAIVVGTRPDIIKMAPVIRYCEKHFPHENWFVIHTGQHYSYELDKVFFDTLRLPEPKYRLEVKSAGPHMQGTHTGTLLLKMEEILLKELPGVILVHGDTNTALAGALLASKISTTRAYTGYCIKIGHVEAGLRSYDRTMPEEINRLVADHLSDYLFVPTVYGKECARKEGIRDDKVFVTGNTIVDAVSQSLPEIDKSDVLEKFGLKKNNYMLVTVHRQENVDNKENLEGVFSGLVGVFKEFNMPIIYPMHPRARKMAEAHGLKVPGCVKVVKPLGYFDFLKLEKEARLVFTDSGGVQEESCIFNVPCVTLRENTERPETLEIHSNMLAGTSRDRILNATKMMMSSDRKWKHPFGDGHAAEKMIRILEENLGK